MDPFTIVTEGLRKIFELREAIKRQKRVNYQTYMRLMQIRVELELSEQPLQSNATLQHSDTMVKFAKAVDRFLKYLQKYRAMHRIGRVFKYSEMEDERLDIVDEIDQLFKMLNLAMFVTVTNLEASEATNAAHFRAKLEHMHGDIRLTHDQVQAALQQLVEKRNTEMAKQKKQADRSPERKTSSHNKTARPRVLARQPPIRRKYSAIDLDDDVLAQKPAEKNTNVLDTGEKKLPIEVKMRPASPEPQGMPVLIPNAVPKQNAIGASAKKQPIKPELSPASDTKEEDVLIIQKHTPDLETAAAQQNPSVIVVEEMALSIQQSAVVENTPCGDLMEEKAPVETEKSTATVVLEEQAEPEPEPSVLDGVDEKVVVNWHSLMQRITANTATCETQPTDPEPALKQDNVVSVPLIIQKLGSGEATTFQQEQSLLLLITKCTSSNNRVQVYKAGGIQVLERLVQTTESFLVQLYALHCLSWFTFSYSKMRESDFTRLHGSVRDATHPEILSVLYELQDCDENVKEAAVIRCSCLATSGNGDNLRRAGVLPLLIDILTNGTANQKLWAAETLETLASNNDESCAEIAREGGIPPLVTLLRSGSDMQKQEAAYALGSMAANDDETRAKIAREGAIPPMVAFVKAVTDAQNHWAVYALGMLSSNNEANRVLIAEEGAITPLVALLRDGTRSQKQWAAYTLGNLAYNNDANRVNITKEGAIAPLIKLLQVGTDSQKQWAAYAMGNLACDNDAVMDLDEAILPLVELVRTGSDSQKQGAAYTLGTLASNNDGSRVEIGRQGAIKPLVALLQSGTDEQKEWAAYAVGFIAKNNDENRAAVVQEGAIEHLAVLAETGNESQQTKATRALELLTCNDSSAVHIMSPWMDYLRAEVSAQTANAVAALSTFETVREGVMPLLQSLVKDPKRQLKAIQPSPITSDAPLDLKEGNRLQDTADAWRILQFSRLPPLGYQALPFIFAMSFILDMIIPGSGAVADVLLSISQFCSEMSEGQDACKHVHTRLKELFDEMEKMGAKGQLPSSDTREKYASVVASYLKYLDAYRGNSLVDRLVKRQTMLDELNEIYEDVERLFQLLNLASIATMMDWKKQWQADQLAEQQALTTLVGNSAEILRELTSTRAQVEALMTLQFEMEHRASRQNDDMMQLIKAMRVTVVRASTAKVHSLPLWFIPSAELQFQQKPFAKGSFASVHHGIWGHGTKVVVKRFFLSSLTSDEDARRKIEAEMNIWHGLNHLNVIRMFGASHVSAPPYIVSEVATNGDLSSFLARSEANKRQMWHLLYEAAQGLEYIHKKNVVHGDLKLNNILVAAGPQAKLSDFGLSAVRTSSTLSKPSGADTEASGGLRWRAPECLESRPTFASDIYSFAMCMLEAVLDEPPSAYLDDNAVRANLRLGVIPPRPDRMSDDVWELVVAMTHADPSKRAGLAQVLSKLESVAAEEAARNAQSPEFGQNAAAVTSATPLALDPTNPTVMLVNEIAGETDAIKREQKLFLLVQKCVEDDHRRLMYAANGLDVLTGLIRNGQTYFTQAYALECLRWAMAPDGQLTKTEMNALQKCVRAISPEELASVVQALQNGTGQAKDDAAVRCACIAAQGGAKELQAADVVPLLVTLVTSGNDTQKLWAVEALRYLSLDDTAVRDDLVKRDLMEPLVTLLLVGTEAQKHRAAYTMGNIAGIAGVAAKASWKGVLPSLSGLLRSGTDVRKFAALFALGSLAELDDESREMVNREGVIPAIVALVRGGTQLQKKEAIWTLRRLVSSDCSAEVVRAGSIPLLAALLKDEKNSQREDAACILGILGSVSDNNRAEITSAGAISPLLDLLRLGSEGHKEHAAWALGKLVYDGNRAEITREGTIASLLGLLRAGTEAQKTASAFALANIAQNDPTTKRAITGDGGIPLLVTLAKTGAEKQKEHAAWALGKLTYDGNRSAIALAVAPLVELLRAGTDEQKVAAAFALGWVTCTNDDNGALASQNGAIELLVALVQGGTERQKEYGAFALGNLACAENVSNIARQGAIPQLVALVRDGSDRQKEGAAYALGKIGLNNAENRDEIVKSGAIPSVMLQLQGGLDKHKENAAWTLGRLAFDGDCAEIARLAITPLVTLLRTGTSVQKKAATFALKNIGSDSDEHRAAITREGGIECLVLLLQSETGAENSTSTSPSTMKDHVCWALGELAYPDNRAAMAKIAISPLLAILQTGTDQQKEAASFALGKISTKNAAISATIAREGGISSLAALLLSGTEAQKVGAAYAVGRLAYTNQSCRTALTKEGGIAALVRMLRDGTNTQKSGALFALEKICFKHCEETTVVVRQGAIAPLVALLAAESNEHNSIAANTLGHLAHPEGDKDIHAEIVREGAVASLVALLLDGDESAKVNSAYALKNICSSKVGRAAAKSGGATAPLQELARNGEGDQQEYAKRALKHLHSVSCCKLQ